MAALPDFPVAPPHGAPWDALDFWYYYSPEDTSKKKLERLGDATRRDKYDDSGLPDPTNIKRVYELAPDGKGFYVYERVGDQDVRPPSYITREQFTRMREKEMRDDYFRELAGNSSKASTKPRSLLEPQLNVNSKLFATIFGSNKIDIKPNVSVLLDFSVRLNRMKNPSLTIRQQRNTSFNFNQQIQMDVVASIGEKLKFRINYDTEATFGFENQMKLNYQGNEDDIIKAIEAGNVSMPINGTLITGGQNLFGVKVVTQWGPVWVTTLASVQRGKTEEVSVRGGAQETKFQLESANYDMNRHFFLSHHFRHLYEQSLRNLPLVNSPVNINRVEIWVTNKFNRENTNTRNCVGLPDLGENAPLPDAIDASTGIRSPRGGRLLQTDPTIIQTNPAFNAPDNSANTLYQTINSTAGTRERTTVKNALTGLQLVEEQDFEIYQNMRRLSENEYTLNRQLGFVSLNAQLQDDEAIYVAFEYTLAGDQRVFRVGEFSVDQTENQTAPTVIFLKMLKPGRQAVITNSGSQFPTWDLMMKNVYSIGGFNIQPDGFNFEVFYQSTDGSGDINYLPGSDVANRPLLQVFGVDRLTNNSELGPDSRFDFIPGITILPDKGVVIFPVLEPFGQHLVNQFRTNRTEDSIRYAFTPLYRRTQQDAIQFSPQLNRFRLKGRYSGKSSSEIYLNTVQLTPGSIKVLSGGRVLQEGVDYTVDYQIGKVSIINPGILSSGQDISVKFETNSLFGIDQKTMLGARVEYRVNKDVQFGGTVLHLNERPLINKIIIGEEPISNTVYGFDAAIRKESRGLTNLLDKLPFYDTKAPSDIQFNGEFAQILPNMPRQVRTANENGIAYIDDFEGARNTIDLMGFTFWKIASRPSHRFSLESGDILSSGYRRAKMAWYMIDPVFYDQPRQFGFDDASPSLNSHYSRRVNPSEVYPGRDFNAGNNVLTTFDLHYWPERRGMYNLESRASRLNTDGSFTNPADNWAGIMRRTASNTDFDAANFEFVEFWVMDPYMDTPAHNGGDLYLNLGRVSEDILNDGSLSAEHGLPARQDLKDQGVGFTETEWGRIPSQPPPTSAFDNSPDARNLQDVGLDGLQDGEERDKFALKLQEAQAVLNGEAFAVLSNDPASDNYAHFRAAAYGNGTPILERYQEFNNVQGNSPLNQAGEQFSQMATPNPDIEDLNADGKISSEEQFYEYRISMRRSDLVVGQNYVVDRRVVDVDSPDKQPRQAVWYQFRVPLRSGSPIGGIADFKSMNFIRMYVTNFDQEVIMRFGKFDLVATQWRTYRDDLRPGGPVLDEEPIDRLANFSLGTINVEENASRQPFPYVVPPDIQRQVNPGQAQVGLRMNEQALVMRVTELEEGDARGLFKTLNLDLRNYERLKMWLHAEPLAGECANPAFNACGDAEIFVRLGTDLNENFYEYRMPLCPSVPGSTDERGIWANDLNLELANLNRAKFLRNEEVERGGRSILQPYEYALGDGTTVIVQGTPQLNSVKNIMIGVRNPSNNGQPVCMEVWANELRVTDFINRAGWAMNARVNMKLADLGNVSFAVQHSTAGFGSIEQRINQRSLETVTQYDVATSLNMGKLMPKEARLELPVYFTMSERFVNPLFNPNDPDILLEDAKTLINPLEQDKYVKDRQDYTKTWGYAFNNVRRLAREGNKKIKPWSLANFSFTYGFNERYHTNTQIESHINRTWNGGINYTYNVNAKPLEPFKNVGKKPNLLNQINFSYLPKTVTFRMEGLRRYDELIYRQLSRNQRPLAPVYNQDFTITRTYQVRWDFTRSLSMNYTASNIGRVDEPRGRLDTREKRDSLMQNLFYLGRNRELGKDQLVNFGRNISFQQNVALTYRLPFDKVSYLDWITGSVNYTVDYRWLTAAVQNQNLGNRISNTRSIQNTGQLNMAQLYKKFPIVDRWISPIKDKNVISKADSSRKEDDDAYVGLIALGKAFARMVFSIQTIDVNYTVNQGTQLPGYLPRTNNFGMDWDYPDSLGGGSAHAPGLPFLMGWQPELAPGGWINEAGARGWFSRDSTLINPYNQTDSRQLTVRTALELFKGFRFDVNVDRARSWNANGMYTYSPSQNDYIFSNRQLNGTFTMTTITLFTAFEGGADISKAFAKFDNNRRIVSKRLAEANPNYQNAPGFGEVASLTNRSANGYYNGYLGNNQDVLIPAFLSAYGPYNVNRMNLTAFPAVPLPNWNATFNGLGEIPWFKQRFRSVTLRHGYRSTYSTGYMLNLNNYDLDRNGIPDSNNVVGDGYYFGDPTALVSVYNLQTENLITNVMIQEQFTPLVGLNFAWKNGITTTVDFKRSRSLALNIGAMQLAEARNTELSINLSYRKDGLLPSFSLFGKERQLKNTITFRFETTVRSIRMANRKLDSLEPPLPTGGNINLVIKPGIDYQISTQITARAYVEHNRNTPVISTSFPTSFTAIGVQIQFNLTSL